MSSNKAFLGQEKIGTSVLRPIDYALILIGYVLATGFAEILNKLHLFTYPAPQQWSALPLTLVPITLISWSVVSGFSKVYTDDPDESLSYFTVNLFKTVGLWAVFSLGALFLARLKYNSRQFTLEFILCASALIVMRRVLTAALLRRFRGAGYDRSTALVLGEKASCERFVSQAALLRPKRYQFIPVTVGSTGMLANGDRELAKSDADELFVVGAAPSLQSSDNPAVRFLRQGKSVHIVPDVVDATLFRQTLGEIGGMPVLSISCGRLTLFEEFVKRAFDVTCAFMLLALTAPVWLLTAILIKLTSRGPILFCQKRLGKEGRPFTMLKFRTMRTRAEDELKRCPELYERYLANNYKLPAGQDPRLTPIGGLLRAFSIDELPQLVNVLKGEMSLVGPRPIVPLEIERYGEFASLFLSVKPGVTGDWQVSGRSEILEYRERVELDLKYIRDQSIWTDVEILLRTVPSVLRRKGAY
jgi:exopolysaccharide production protein ExoY